MLAILIVCILVGALLICIPFVYEYGTFALATILAQIAFGGFLLSFSFVNVITLLANSNDGSYFGPDPFLIGTMTVGITVLATGLINYKKFDL